MVSDDDEIKGMKIALDLAFSSLWVELVLRQEFVDTNECKFAALYDILNHVMCLTKTLVGDAEKNHILAILQFSIGKSIGSFDDPSTTHKAQESLKEEDTHIRTARVIRTRSLH